jgi:formylglycine-generating enzyme required for sulfatase activity
MLRVAIALLFLLVPSVAQSEGRFALLIGNEAYAPAVGALANPHNDVAILEAALKGLGFEVDVEHDVGLGAMTRAVNAYARRVQAAGPDAIGLFYYSGHGAADGNTNYLIPVDVKTTETGELWDQSMQLTEITRKLKRDAGNATHFVVFDACRNTLRLRQPGSRAVVQAKGFVPVAQENGMLIAYATAEGELASDVGAGAGPYANTLAEEIVKPGVEAVVMFRAVQRRVRAAIRQEPYLGFNALGDIYLAGKVEPPAAAPVKPPSQVRQSDAAEAWNATKDTTSIAVLELFIASYKDTYYAGLARLRIEELKKRQEAAELAANEAKKNADEEARPKAQAEQQRLALQQQRADAARRDPALSVVPGSGKSFRDCQACPEMVVVPAGHFTMGSPANEPNRFGEELQVLVSIARPFAVGVFAVTFDEWDACVVGGGCNGYQPKDEGWGRGKRPVINVSWDDTKAYTAWLSHKTGMIYRLPSEAEREYFTRAGTTTPFWWGSSITPKQANYDGSAELYEGGGSKGENRRRTVPVDSFNPNPWGLYNVHGNVWEWTEDCWNDSNSGNPGNGTARTTGDCSERMVRGGSWLDQPAFLRSANRIRYYGSHSHDWRIYDRGFRVARTLTP